MLNFFVIISTINPLYLYFYIYIYIYIYIYTHTHIYIYTYIGHFANLDHLKYISVVFNNRKKYVFTYFFFVVYLEATKSK